MSISYTITVKDELNDVKRLHHTLQMCKKPEDEIIAVHLYHTHSEIEEPIHIEIKDYLLDNIDTYCNYKDENNIAHLKNYECHLSTKDYIFLLDANEYLTTQTLLLWNQVIKNQPDYDIFWTPRINIDDTLTTEEKENKYGMKLNDRGWINWPDNQPRIIKKEAGLVWVQQEQGLSIKNTNKTGALAPDPRLATINHKREK